MTARDWLEIGWHASLVLFASRTVLSFLLRNAAARRLLAAVIVIALAYHVAVVNDCHQWIEYHRGGGLCTWG